MFITGSAGYIGSYTMAQPRTIHYKNDNLTSGYKTVYPKDIESYFNTLKNCDEYAIFAGNYIWPSQILTNESLIIVYRPTTGANKKDLVERFKEKKSTLVNFKRISGHVIWHEEFPRTASLKLKRKLLASQIREKYNRESALEELYL